MSRPRANELMEFLGDQWVMVVDPSSHMRDSIRRFLVNLGVKKVKLLSSAAEAKRELVTTQVGFFIVEWILPDLNGLELCRAIRKKKAFENKPFLLITAENLKSDVILASEAGINAYLIKPFAYDDFCAQVNHLVKAAITPPKITQLIQVAEQKLADGNLEDARVVFNAVLLEKDNSARAFTGLGRISARTKNYKEAKSYFENAIAANPDYLEAYSAMIDLCEITKDRELQKNIAEQAHQISPDNPRYTLILAKIYFDEKNLLKSEELFKKTISLSPKLGEAYHGLGNVQFEKLEYERAVKNYKKALDLQPGDISVINSIGLSYVKQGQVNKGIEHYKIALRIDSNDWRVLFNLGFAYEKNADIALAIQAYERALIVYPDLEKAERRLKKLRSVDKSA